MDSVKISELPQRHFKQMYSRHVLSRIQVVLNPGPYARQNDNSEWLIRGAVSILAWKMSGFISGIYVCRYLCVTALIVF